MKNEKSCGTIIINNGKVLVIKQKKSGTYNFPKGHMEKGETEEQTAIRETKEEINLIVNIDSNKRFELSYLQKENIYKTVVYFIAYINDINSLKLKNDEVIEAKWIKIDEVEDILSFENLKKLWSKVLKSIK